MKKKPMSQAEYLLNVREQYVAKDNALVLKGRYNLTVEEQKIILYLISKIKPTDTDLQTYEFSIAEFCKVCGIQYGGRSYKDLLTHLEKLNEQKTTVLPDGTITNIGWINKFWVKTSGVMQIRLDEDLKPYLLQLKKNYTQYQLIYTLSFKCKYAIRLYEVVCCLHYDVFKPFEYTYTIEELTQQMGAETYALFKDFNKRALIPAVAEINANTDKQLTVEYIKQGKKVIGIKLHIETKPTVDRDHIRAELDKRFGVDEQISIWQQMDNARGTGTDEE